MEGSGGKSPELRVQCPETEDVPDTGATRPILGPILGPPRYWGHPERYLLRAFLMSYFWPNCDGRDFWSERGVRGRIVRILEKALGEWRSVLVLLNVNGRIVVRILSPGFDSLRTMTVVGLSFRSFWTDRLFSA